MRTLAILLLSVSTLVAQETEPEPDDSVLNELKSLNAQQAILIRELQAQTKILQANSDKLDRLLGGPRTYESDEPTGPVTMLDESDPPPPEPPEPAGPTPPPEVEPSPVVKAGGAIQPQFEDGTTVVLHPQTGLPVRVGTIWHGYNVGQAYVIERIWDRGKMPVQTVTYQGGSPPQPIGPEIYRGGNRER